MTQDQLKAILARNPQITINENSSGGKVHNPEPKQDPAPALERVEEGKEESLRRVSVSFTGYRVRLLDPDNFAGSVKDLLDCLRQSKLIYDDSPDHIILSTSQVKVHTRKEERTEIDIEYEEP